MINQIPIKVVSAILLLALSSCKTDKNAEDEKSLTLQAKDSWKYKHLMGKFYTDKYGKLFEQKAYAIAGKDETINSQIYFDSLVYINLTDTVIEKSLSEVIDIKTYEEFDEGTMYSKDKNNIYYSNASTSGDFRLLVSGTNPKTFKPLPDYLYGIDNKNIFYRGKKIEGLNFQKHQILYSLDTTDFSIDYVKDDKVVFYNGDKVKGADAKTFKLVAGQKWTAEDKNYKYECCGQRIE
jgi:hypothetical protein